MTVFKYVRTNSKSWCVARWRFRRVRVILREFSHLFSKFDCIMHQSFDIKQLANVIRQSGAGIVGLNESCGAEKHINEKLAAGLGWNVLYGGN